MFREDKYPRRAGWRDSVLFFSFGRTLHFAPLPLHTTHVFISPPLLRFDHVFFSPNTVSLLPCLVCLNLYIYHPTCMAASRILGQAERERLEGARMGGCRVTKLGVPAGSCFIIFLLFPFVMRQRRELSTWRARIKRSPLFLRLPHSVFSYVCSSW